MLNIPFDVRPVLKTIDNITAKVKSDSILASMYSDFLVVYLLQSHKGAKTITNLTLSLNNIPLKVTEIDNLWCVRFGYVEIVKQRKNSVKVRLTDTAYSMADTFIYDNAIIKRTYLKRFINSIRVIFNAIKVFVLVLGIGLVLVLGLMYLLPLLFTPKGVNIIVVTAGFCTIISTIYLLQRK